MPVECLRSVEARPIGVSDDASSGRTVFGDFLGHAAPTDLRMNTMYVLSPNYRISPFSSLKRAACKFCGAEAFIGAWEGCSKQVWRVEAWQASTHAELQEWFRSNSPYRGAPSPKNRIFLLILPPPFLQFFVWKENFLGKSCVFFVCAWGWTRPGYAGDFIPGHLPPGHLSSIVWMMPKVVDPMAQVLLGRIFLWGFRCLNLQDEASDPAVLPSDHCGRL